MTSAIAAQAARCRACLEATAARALSSSSLRGLSAAASSALAAGEAILPPPRPDALPPASADPRDFFRFEVLHESKVSRARVGRLHTPHGVVETPAFVAVGTNAALKAVDQRRGAHFPRRDQRPGLAVVNAAAPQPHR